VVVRIEDVLEKAESYFKPEEIDLLHKAYVFSAREHRGQTRLSGQPYLSHVLEVANILADMKLDPVTVAVGLLHDIVEDTLTSLFVIEDYFGKEVAHLVDGVTKISRFAYTSLEDRQADYFRKMLVAMVDDIRVIIVKLADRLHNMRTLDYLDREKQERIARETMEVYAPIAHRLGIGRWKNELEDLAFKYLHPDDFQKVLEKVEEKKHVSSGFIQDTMQKLKTLLEEQGIKADIEGRVKRYYSIFRKTREREISLDEIFDYIAFRVITENEKNCYAALGLIHTTWKPIPGRFKDYIAVPKPNLYRSLHTTVLGSGGHPFEIQIRTSKMHKLAEEGVAAHWSYKEGKLVELKEIQNFAWLRHLVELQQEIKDSKEFMDSVKLELYPDEVYVFTPKGEVKSLKRGATPIDFAYGVHSEIGHHCVGAKVNGKLVPLRTLLRNGDIVEILTLPEHYPSRDWLKIVTTSRARQKIKHFLNIEQKKHCIEIGKKLLVKELRRYKHGSKELVKDNEIMKIVPSFGLTKLEELYAALGFGKVSTRQVIVRMIKAGILESSKVQEDTASEKPEKEAPKVHGTGILVRGHDDFMTYLARCCNPIGGEPIVGYITQGKGVSVHTRNCPNVSRLLYNSERIIEVEWAEKDGILYQVPVSVAIIDRPGMLAKITARIAEQNTNIKNVKARGSEGDKATLDLILEIRNIQQLESLCQSLKRIDGVLEVYRPLRNP
jgi:GTP pyrophosphokinase